VCVCVGGGGGGYMKRLGQCVGVKKKGLLYDNVGAAFPSVPL
jgi:hypothetical protein